MKHSPRDAPKQRMTASPLPSPRPSFIRTLMLLLIALAIGGIAAASLLYKNRKIPNPKSAPLEPVNVVVETVKLTPTLSDTLLLPAVVEVNREVAVSAEVAGRIMKICCTDGAPCRKGDLLVELNTEILQAEYDRAKAQAIFDEKEYKRIASLEAGGAATAKQADEARSRMEISKAGTELARARLERARIVSPISGILDKVPVEEGEYLQPGTVVAKIVNIDAVKAVVQVPEPDIQYFKKGDKAEVFFENHGRPKRRTGAISYVSELADARTRSTRVEIEVDNRARKLRSGRIVRARLTRRVLKDVIMVPLLAIIPLEKGYRVYVAEGDTAHVRNITTSRLIKKGAAGIDRVQVLSGLKPGEKLIVASHRFVGDGQKIRIIETGAKALEGVRAEGKLGK